MKIILPLLALALITCSQPKGPASAKDKVILAIFAHPDDEATVGPVLAKYASEGVSVYIAVATDGRLGVAEHAGIPAGDSLAAVRAEEMKCAAATLGIHPPIMIGMHDQLKMKMSLNALTGQLDTIRATVLKLMTELKPDVVLTWGPDGWTGHHDHRLVGSIVTEVYASQSWPKPVALYYAGIATGSLPKDLPMSLATVDARWLTVKVSVSTSDYDKAKAAWLCHKSQYKPETIDQMDGLIRSVGKGSVMFRPFEFTGKEQGFFP